MPRGKSACSYSLFSQEWIVLPGKRVTSGESLQPSASCCFSGSWARTLKANNTRALHKNTLSRNFMMGISPRLAWLHSTELRRAAANGGGFVDSDGGAG